MSVPQHIIVRVNQRNKILKPVDQIDSNSKSESNTNLLERNASNFGDIQFEMQNLEVTKEKPKNNVKTVKKLSAIQFVNDLIYLQKDEFEFAKSNVHFLVGDYEPISVHSFVLLTRSAWFRRSWRARDCGDPIYNFRREKTNSTNIEIECIQPIPDNIGGEFKFIIEENQNDTNELRALYLSLIEFKNFLYIGHCKVNYLNVKYLVSLSYAFETSLTSFLTTYLLKTISEKDINGLLYRLELAHIYSIDELKQACINVVNKNSVQIVNSSEWEEFAKIHSALVFEMFRENE